MGDVRAAGLRHARTALAAASILTAFSLLAGTLVEATCNSLRKRGARIFRPELVRPPSYPPTPAAGR